MASLGVRVTFKEDIQKVWDVITSVDKYKAWRSDLKEIEIIDEEQYVETTEDGYVTTYIVVRRAEGKRLELEVENETLSGHLGEVDYQHRVDLCLEEVEALRLPYRRLTQPLLSVPLPVVTLLCRCELIAVRWVAAFEDSAQLVVAHRQHLVRHHREAEQRLEHLELVLRDEVLHHCEEIRQGLRHTLTAFEQGHRHPCPTASVHP